MKFFGYTVELYYLSHSKEEAVFVGRFTLANIISQVYPDKGQNKFGESELHSFDVFPRKDVWKVSIENIDLDHTQEKLAFSLDCNDVQPSDPIIQRLSDGTFEQLDTSLFSAEGDYQM